MSGRVLALLCLLATAWGVSAGAEVLPALALKRLSLEELLQQEVVLASRRPEPVLRVPAAVQVITAETIRQSGAVRLAEALRLAPNLQVAQIDAQRWAVSARGFNSVLANKLLVQIDGRSIYSPLYAGVFWAGQEVWMADVERIEVVSGPGGALWGANAVNGVINVRTKSARETPGGLLEAGFGEGLQARVAVRQGVRWGEAGHLRVYGTMNEWDGPASRAPAVAEEGGRTRSVQAGFRGDWALTVTDTLTVQGDGYRRWFDRGAGRRDARLAGANVLARWVRERAEDAGVEVQVFVDRAERDLPASYHDRLDTFDVDYQQRAGGAGGRHLWVWGVGYRRIEDEFRARRIVLEPGRRSWDKVSAFVHDEVTVRPDRLIVALGAKAEWSDDSDWEFSPSVRLAWTPDARQTWWAAISRAVRTPSRLDRDRVIVPVLAGSPDFDSEVLLAWEAGWRAQPHERWMVSVNGFYHDYDRLRSVEWAPAGAPAPLVIGNGQRGRSYGVETAVEWRASDRWRWQLAWTEMRVAIEPEPWSRDTSRGALEAVDADRHAALRVFGDWPRGVETYLGFRYTSRLTSPAADVPGYTELDARLAWRPAERWELSLVGQGLLHRRRVEYDDPTMRHEVERGVHALVRWEY